MPGGSHRLGPSCRLVPGHIRKALPLLPIVRWPSHLLPSATRAHRGADTGRKALSRGLTPQPRPAPKSAASEANQAQFHAPTATWTWADAATLQSGGWDLQAARAPPVGTLPQPANLAASGGDLDGTVDLTWDAIRRGVQSYVAEQATASSGPWTQCYVGKASKCTVTGLTSGTQYWFQVKAIGAAGPSAWSDPATKRAT